MTTGARVLIEGNPIPSAWDGSDVLAVDGLHIDWGRTDPYADPDPSILTLTLIDRSGAFMTDPGRIGQSVTVEMVDPARVMFRGTITKPSARRTGVHNPSLNATEQVWLVTVTASDSMAGLGMAVFAGDATDGMREGAGGWGEIGPDARLARVFSAGAAGIVGGYDLVPPITANPPVWRIMHGQSAADARTALELIQQAYRGVPLGVAGYNPDTDTVVLTQLTESSTVRLVLDNGVVRLQLPTGQVVPASKVGVDSYTLESGVATAIDAVQVSYFWYGKDPAVQPGSTNVKRTIYTEGFIEGRTTRYDARSRRVLKIATQYITFDPTEFVAGAVDAYNRFPAWLLERIVAIVNKLNGQVRIPKLTFDAKRTPLPAALEDLIYRPVAPSVPLYFIGSIFTGLRGVGPQFQIIGGRLTYQDGWRHEVTVCTTGPAVESPLTLAQLSSHATATLADVDPDLSIADLATVTTGVPA